MIPARRGASRWSGRGAAVSRRVGSPRTSGRAVRPLPGRRNVVLSRQTDFMVDGAEVVGSLQAAFATFETEPETWVIGGAQIYLLALPHANRCEVTEVDIDLPRDDDDALAPVLDDTWLAEMGEWQLSRSGLRYRFHSYSRR